MNHLEEYMAQERVQRQKGKGRDQEESVEATGADVADQELAEKTEATLGSIDDVLEDQLDAELLADIDDVLGTEEEAAQMVRDFVQQGGE